MTSLNYDVIIERKTTIVSMQTDPIRNDSNILFPSVIQYFIFVLLFFSLFLSPSLSLSLSYLFIPPILFNFIIKTNKLNNCTDFLLSWKWIVCALAVIEGKNRVVEKLSFFAGSLYDITVPLSDEPFTHLETRAYMQIGKCCYVLHTIDEMG